MCIFDAIVMVFSVPSHSHLLVYSISTSPPAPLFIIKSGSCAGRSYEERRRVRERMLGRMIAFTTV